MSAKAALRLKHKLQQVMKNRDDQLVLRGLLLMDDAYWAASGATAREDGALPARTPWSPPCGHPHLAGHPLYLKLSHLSGFIRDEIAAWSARFIEPGSHVVSDGLSCLPAVTDGQYRRRTDHHPQERSV